MLSKVIIENSPYMFVRELEKAIKDAIDGLSTEVTTGNIDNIVCALREALTNDRR